MRCVDVAALFAAAILRRNPASVVVPFDTQAYDAKLDPNDSILSLSERLARYGGGGTDCSLPLQAANTRFSKRKFAGVVLVSDNQSWVYQHQAFAAGTNGATGVVTQWNQFVQNQKKLGATSPKLICIDLQPLFVSCQSYYWYMARNLISHAGHELSRTHFFNCYPEKYGTITSTFLTYTSGVKCS